jgi:hypothetical protein
VALCQERRLNCCWRAEVQASACGMDGRGLGSLEWTRAVPKEGGSFGLARVRCPPRCCRRVAGAWRKREGTMTGKQGVSRVRLVAVGFVWLVVGSDGAPRKYNR